MMGKGRAPCCDKSKVKKGPWSPAEDLRLITFIQKHGHENWRALPKQAGLLRCGKSCRLRWINYLRPDLKRGSFTKEEEDMIIQLHQTLGNKWSKIASNFPGRTDNEIKNVWNTHFKKRLALMDANPESSSSSSSSSFNNISMSQSDEDMGTKADHQQPQNSLTGNQELLQKDPIRDHHLKEITKKPTGSSSSATSSSSVNSTVQNADQADVTKQGNPEDQDTALEIPLESDVDFWNMLDSLSNSDSEMPVAVGNAEESITSNFGDSYLEEIENKRWLSYLQNELGLEETSEAYRENLIGDAIEQELPGDPVPYDNLLEPEIDSELGYYCLWPSL